MPGTTTVRDLSARQPPSRPGGRERRPLFEGVDAWAARQPKGRWRTFRVRDGEKGPLQVRAAQPWVQTTDEDGGPGPRERLVVIQSCVAPAQTWTTLSNAKAEVPLAAVVRTHGQRHRVEELLQEGQGEVGLNHCEVRSWVGWHHHVTLTLLALWFLQTERLRVAKKNPPVTVPQIRALFTELLQKRPPTAAAVAQEVSQVLRRNEEARIYHWYSATGQFPPPRLRPGPAPPQTHARK